MSEIACPSCGTLASDLNPRCPRCGTPLPAESRRIGWGADPALAPTVLGPGGPSVTGAVPAAEVQATAGASLGRFTVLEELGRGTMGVVVKAHDPELDRMVAIKVLRPEALGLMGEAEARERLLREAKAMARVSHRNVVSVYEVAVVGGQVLVVMEHIKGRTLRAWLREAPRSTEAMVDAFLQAGRGLAEVHRAGLVHRDFKPDNILVGADGRVCITDFGLVGLVQDQVDSRTITRNAAEPRAPVEVLSTGTSVLMGTPAYMAPEQHRLQRADARADQFAFCVALYEALYGERPFAGKGYEEIKASVLAGALRPAPAGATVPARLRRIAARGLALDPAGRYPSMAALVTDLEKDPRVARRRALLGVAAGGLVAVAAFGVLRSGAALCRGGADKLAGVWDAPAKAKLEQAFLATGKPYAADAFARVARVLDERAGAWVAMYRDSCEATHVRGEQSAPLLDARTECLERRRAELSALVAQLGSEPGADILNRALEAAYALPRLDACANRDALLAAVPLPSDPGALARIGAAREALAKASAQLRTSRFKEGLETVKAVQDEVKAAGYAPLTAELLWLRGSLEQELDEAAAAEETLRSAAVEAAKARNDALLAKIWTLAIEVIGNKRARPAEALALEAPAEGAVERAGGSPFLRGRLLANVSNVLHRKGDDPRALEVARRAVAILEQAPGGESPDLALALVAQGNALFSMRQMEETRASFQRALDIRERIFGATHSSVASSLHALAKVYGAAGQVEKALPPSQRALAIYEELLGPDSTKVADSLSNQGLILTDLGRYDEALQAHRRALAIREKTYDGDHPSIAAALQNLAYTL
ncbi:MAG TPA: tetratricopeptide repeat protein, partial [Myxococcales bacterium]|nr:tetratricopeptide repeat protein [Myxococcales bacterium]